MLTLSAVNVLIVIGFLLAGAVVILKNSRALLNRLFFGFIVTISAWVIANFLSNDQSIRYSVALAANHLTLFIPGLVLLFLLNFSMNIAGQSVTRKWVGVNLYFFLVYSLSLTPLVFSSIHKQGHVYAIDFKSFGSLYFLSLFLNMFLVIYVLVRGRQHATGEQRKSLSVILWSLLVFLSINVTTNAILPTLGGSFALTNLGPISAVFVIYALWYSIVKHRLFDIKFIISRSLGYVLSLLTIALIFTGGTFALTSLVFTQTTADSTVRWVYALVATIIAFLFAPLKRFFDKYTNRLFYKDAYDPRAFLDQLNKTIIDNIELGILLRRTALVIEDNMRCEHVIFAIWSDANIRFIGSKAKDNTIEHLQAIREGIKKTEDAVIVYDNLNEDDPLKKLLRDNNIAVVAPLQTGGDYGCICIGPRKSGNTFINEDVKMIEIIANELTIAVQNALRFEEIQNFNVTLQQRINEATRKLRHANERLKALDETKDDFISMASHQLRTPLTSVKGYLSMVLEGDAGKISKTQQEMLSQAFFSSQRMVYIIADLLNVSRLKTGKFIIEPAPVNLAELVEQEIEQLKETLAARDLTLIYDKPKDFPTLLLDETKTRQVIMNFVDNAIYYTPAGGHINVRLVNQPSTIELRVEDDGIGVPRREQPHLFTKFYRAGNARKARPDGTGLGLFMAKKVIIAESGSVIFESQEGKGSTFGFIFSKSKLAASGQNPKNESAAASR